MTERSEQAAARWRAAKGEANRLRAELVEAVKADRAAGASLNDLATVLGVSREAVRKMAGDPDDRLSFDATRQVRCPKCNAAPGVRCDNPRAHFHIERHNRRHGVQMGTVTDLDEDEVAAMAGPLLGS